MKNRNENGEKVFRVFLCRWKGSRWNAADSQSDSFASKIMSFHRDNLGLGTCSVFSARFIFSSSLPPSPSSSSRLDFKRLPMRRREIFPRFSPSPTIALQFFISLERIKIVFPSCLNGMWIWEGEGEQEFPFHLSSCFPRTLCALFTSSSLTATSIMDVCKHHALYHKKFTHMFHTFSVWHEESQ